jgi:hypothetical protein
MMMADSGSGTAARSTGGVGWRASWTEPEPPTARYDYRAEPFPDFGHIEVQLTIDDPKAYTNPWTVN